MTRELPMTYIHQRVPLNDGDTVIIDSSHCCRAYLMHKWDYDSFLENKGFSYADRSDTAAFDLDLTTAKLHVSRGGVWDMIIVFETHAKENVRYSVDVLHELS
jgi:hypothetical protein